MIIYYQRSFKKEGGSENSQYKRKKEGEKGPQITKCRHENFQFSPLKPVNKILKLTLNSYVLQIKQLP